MKNIFSKKISGYAFSILLLTIAIIGLGKLSVDVDYESYFDGESDRLNQHRAMEELYGRQDSIRLVLGFKENVDTKKWLVTVEQLTERAWKIPYSTRVDSLTNYPYVTYDEDEINIKSLYVTSDSLVSDELEKRVQYAKSHASIRGRLLSEDYQYSMINVIVTLPEDKNTAQKEIMDDLQKIREEIRREHGDIAVFISGSIPINSAFYNGATTGMVKLLMLGIILVMLYIALVYRSFFAVAGTMITVVISMICSLGVGAHFGIPITGPTSSALMVVIAISLANAVHLISKYSQLYPSNGSSKDSIQESIRLNILPVTLTSLTTAVGLLCLNFGEIPPYRDMGNIAAIGVFSNLLFTFTVLPLFVRFKVRSLSNDGDKRACWDKIAVFTHKNTTGIIIVFLVISALALVLVPRNEINDSLLSHFREGTLIKTESEHIMDNAGPIYQLSISTPAGEYESITNPEYLLKLERFIAWLRDQPEVINAYSFLDDYKTVSSSFLDLDEDEFDFGYSEDQLGQIYLMYEMSLPFGADLSNQVSATREDARIIVGVKNITNNEIRYLERKIIDWQSANLPLSMQTAPTGPNILFAHIWYDATISNLFASAIAIMTISLIIAITFKSLIFGVISIIANILPLMIAFGIWTLFVGTVDISTVVAAIIVFGVIVDDTVHIIAAYRREKSEQSELRKVVENIYRTTMPTLLSTSVSIIIGFSALSFSEFDPNYKLALLCVLTVSAAYICDLLLVVPLLSYFDRRKATEISASSKHAAIKTG